MSHFHKKLLVVSVALNYCLTSVFFVSAYAQENPIIKVMSETVRVPTSQKNVTSDCTIKKIK